MAQGWQGPKLHMRRQSVSETETIQALVVGGGPAGLMAADQLAKAGLSVVLAEAKPTLGRKFLMAGKSGLNLTKEEPAADFASNISAAWLRPQLMRFGPEQVCEWARALGVELFTGSSGRVFPKGMKASPLLRAWIVQLAGQGASFRTRWRWQGFSGTDFHFDTPEGPRLLRPAVTVLALGGASWPKLGSDAAWVPFLAGKGVEIEPFRPANMGFCVRWSAHMTHHFGQPVKNVVLTAGGHTARAEFVISARGVEGGGIYALSSSVRDGADLMIDLIPDRTLPDVIKHLQRPRNGSSLSTHLRKSLNLDPARQALLMEWGQPLPQAAEDLARLIKSLPVRHHGPRPIEEAISVAGGIAEKALTADLELRAIPGIFAAGEMLDWEAPTGGYLLTGCLATGKHAGQAAAVKALQREGH